MKPLLYLDPNTLCIIRGELSNIFSIIVWFIDDHVTYNNFSRCHRLANRVANENKMLIQYKKIQFTEYIIIESNLEEDIRIPVLPNGLCHGFMVTKNYTLVYKDGYVVKRLYYPPEDFRIYNIEKEYSKDEDGYINIFIKNKNKKKDEEYILGWLVSRGNWETLAIYENRLEVATIYLGGDSINNEVSPLKTFINQVGETVLGHDKIISDDFNREIVKYLYELLF